MLKTSQETYRELCEYIPGGVNSPVRAFSGSKRTPLIIQEAHQDQLIDIEGNAYIDFCASWGALILGHAEPLVVEALERTIQRGTTYGVTSLLEKALAQKVVELIPSIEKVRFVSSGTEATMYALRLARGVTQRDYIVKYVGNYHGCADFLLTEAGSGFATHQASSRGIPKQSVEYTLNLPYNDLEALEELFKKPEYLGKIAAVIIEPVSANMGCVLPEKNYLKRLREITEQAGTLLIFDEVVTGFRLGLTGAQGYFDIDPDLTCLGKIVGGGMPAAAYGGKKKLMDQLSPLGPIYQAGTLSGNPVAMAAGLAVLEEIQKSGFYEALEAKTRAFLTPIEKALLAKKGVGCLQTVGSMFTLFFGVDQVSHMADAQRANAKTFWEFFNFLLDRGIYWPPSPFETAFMMRAHSSEHLKKAQSAILDFISLL